MSSELRGGEAAQDKPAAPEGTGDQQLEIEPDDLDTSDDTFDVDEIQEPDLPEPEVDVDGTVEHPPVEYRRLEAPLYDGPPSGDDVRQGYLNDCYAVAPMLAIADRRPDIIEDRVRAADDGRVEVRLTDPHTGDDDIVAVDPSAPHGTLADGRPLPCHASSDSTAAWPACAEKALASVEQDGYRRLDEGGTDADMAQVLERFTGREADALRTADATDEEILAAVRDAQLQQRPMVCGIDAVDPNDPDAAAYADLLAEHDMSDEHAYSVAGVTDDGRIMLDDPGGRDYVVEPLTPAELRQASPYLITMSDRPIHPTDAS